LALAAGASLASCASSAVQSNASSPTSGAYADFLVGRVANLTDDYSAASDRYTSALARDPSNQDLVDGAVSAALAAGDIERARAAARYGRGPDTPTLVHLVRAADALSAQRWSQAETELGLANSGAAQALEARVMLVWARAGHGNVPEIDSDLRSLMSIRPFGALFQYNQAMALDYAGRQADALAAYQTASGLGMWLPPAIERNADLLARQQGARDLAIRLLDTQDNQTRTRGSIGACARRPKRCSISAHAGARRVGEPLRTGGDLHSGARYAERTRGAYDRVDARSHE
jgi:tetratricopeptide (TPR) repeat protein